MKKELIPAVINELIKVDFLVFAKLILGLDVARPHKEWWGLMKLGDDCIIMAPRDHGKSHVIVRAYSLWKAIHDDHVKEVIILGSDATAAQENLEKLKALLMESRPLSYLMPSTKVGYNTMSRLTLANGVVIKAKGMFSQLRGRHPQLIIADDILNEKNSLSSIQREQTRNYFFSVVYPMKDKGTASTRANGYKPQIVVVGTAQSELDLYSELLKNNEFNGIKQSAIINTETKAVLWPERYSWDDLMKIKRAVGSLTFAKEYQNNPLQEETTLFPYSLLKPLCSELDSYVDNYEGKNNVYMGVDFSIPGSVDGDYTVIVIAERISGDSLKLLKIWRARPESMQAQIESIILLCNKFNVTKGFIEDNVFQKVYADYLKKNTGLPLQGHTVTASGKNSQSNGVLSFIPFFENKKMILPYRTEDDKILTDVLISEFSGFIRKDGKLGNFKYHDDIVMAMWHMKLASRTGHFKFSF